MAIPNFYNALTYPNLRQTTPAETFYSAIKPYEEMKAEQQKNAMDQAKFGMDQAKFSADQAMDQRKMGMDQAKFDKEQKQDAVYMAIRDEGLPPAEMLVKMRTAAFGFGDQEGVKVADEGLKGLSQRFASIGDWKNVARVDALATGGTPTQEGEKFLANEYERSINPPLTKYQQATVDESVRAHKADEQRYKDAALQRSDEQRYRRDDLQLRREAQTAGDIPGMDKRAMATVKILGDLMNDIQNRTKDRFKLFVETATTSGKEDKEAFLWADQMLQADPQAQEDSRQFENYQTQLNLLRERAGLIIVKKPAAPPDQKGSSSRRANMEAMGLVSPSGAPQGSSSPPPMAPAQTDTTRAPVPVSPYQPLALEQYLSGNAVQMAKPRYLSKWGITPGSVEGKMVDKYIQTFNRFPSDQELIELINPPGNPVIGGTALPYGRSPR